MSIENKLLSDIRDADIRELIASRATESGVLDFKRSAYARSDEGKRELVKDVVAFANAQGGMIILGIEEDQDGCATGIVSVPEAEGECARIRQTCNDCVDPRLDGLEARALRVDDATVIVIFVPDETRKPYFQRLPNGFRAPQRNGRETRWLSREDIAEVIRREPMLLGLTELRAAVDGLARNAPARPQVPVTEATAFTATTPEDFLAFARERFLRDVAKAPVFRLTALPLPHRPRSIHEQLNALKPLFESPPEVRQHGWSLKAHGGSVADALGWTIGQLDYRRLVLMRNGYFEFHASAESESFTWNSAGQGSPKHHVLYPYAIAEPTQCFVMLAKMVGEILGAEQFQFGGGLFNVRGTKLLAYAPGTAGYRMALGTLQRGDADPLGWVREWPNDDPLEIMPVTETVAGLPGTAAFRIVQQIYQMFGHTGEHIPFFDKAGTFDLAWNGGPRT